MHSTLPGGILFHLNVHSQTQNWSAAAILLQLKDQTKGLDKGGLAREENRMTHQHSRGLQSRLQPILHNYLGWFKIISCKCISVLNSGLGMPCLHVRMNVPIGMLMN